MHEIWMSLALWDAQNPELRRKHDHARAGFLVLDGVARKPDRRRTLDDIAGDLWDVNHMCKAGRPSGWYCDCISESDKTAEVVE